VPTPPDLSIVIPTCNRAALLEACLRTVRHTVHCAHEIIVVDGASYDDTPAVLAEAADLFGDRLRVITEQSRGGFVRATNLGLRAARGRFLTWLNDDARPLPGALDRAVVQCAAAPADVGLVALYHRWSSARNVAYRSTIDGQPYAICHVRGTLYANFAVGARATFEQLGFLDERFFFYGADPDLSLKAWHAGLRVVPAHEGVAVDHDEAPDDRRAADAAAGRADNARLFAKWDLPPANYFINDFNPDRPCTLRGLRGTSVAA
jgi:GT2 family glycosyltransferase